jgi:hypothetical protein
MNLNNKLIILSSLVFTIICAGCSSVQITKEECISTNWEKQGHLDSLKGRNIEILDFYKSECSDYVVVNEIAYMKGRKAGAEESCTTEKGYILGTLNSQKTDVCQMSNNFDKYNEAYERGYTVYLANYQLEQINNYIQSIDYYLSYGYAKNIQKELIADRDYLYKLRESIQIYTKNTSENGKNFDVKLERKDFSNEYNKMPYPYMITNAEKLANMYNQAEEIAHKIHTTRREFDRNRVDKKNDDTHRKLQCLRNEEYWLRQQIDDLSYKAKYEEIDGYIRPERCNIHYHHR